MWTRQVVKKIAQVEDWFAVNRFVVNNDMTRSPMRRSLCDIWGYCWTRNWIGVSTFMESREDSMELYSLYDQGKDHLFFILPEHHFICCDFFNFHRNNNFLHICLLIPSIIILSFPHKSYKTKHFLNTVRNHQNNSSYNFKTCNSLEVYYKSKLSKNCGNIKSCSAQFKIANIKEY